MALMVRSVVLASLLALSLGFDGPDLSSAQIGEEEVCADGEESECALSLRQLRGRKQTPPQTDVSVHDFQEALVAAPLSYHYHQRQARAFVSLCKITYCGGQAGSTKSFTANCGPKGYCAPAGVKIKPGSARVLSLPDGRSKNAVVALAGVLEHVPGSDKPLQPGCVAAVRGTWPGTNNLFRGKQTKLVPWATGGCVGCRVHKGYQLVWQVLMQKLEATFKAIGCTKSTPIYLTGHSMGGAVATIGLAALKERGWNIAKKQYVFHNPMVFNQASVDYFNKLLTGSEVGVAVTRITHAKDNIPKWPFPSTRYPDYRHTWPEVHYLSMWPEPHYLAKTSEYKVCWRNSQDCGVRSEGKLCGMTACSDHLVNPLAPGKNFAMMKDHVGTCVMGKGDRSANGILPMAALRHRSSQYQLAWLDAKLQKAGLLQTKVRAYAEDEAHDSARPTM